MDFVAPERECAPAPHVRWAQDADRVIVVDELRGLGHELRGVDAAVWSWLALAYPRPKLLRLLGALLGATDAEAADYLGETLEAWRANGLVVSMDGWHG
jgi:hypothetical protein